MKHICCFTALLFLTVNTFAQQLWQQVTTISNGKNSPRTEFVSYDVRTEADNDIYAKSRHFMNLNGNWKFNYCVNPESIIENFANPKFSDKGWATIKIPGTWEAQAFGKVENQSLIDDLDILNPSIAKLTKTSPVGQYRKSIEIPFAWLDRDIFINVSGIESAVQVFVNGKSVGYSSDSKLNAEFNISQFVVEGHNTIALEVYKYSVGKFLEARQTTNNECVAGITGGVYIFSQPKIRINDFIVKTSFDSTGKNGILDLDIVMSNSYNAKEQVTVYYDLMELDGKIIRYNYSTIQIQGMCNMDTVHFQGIVNNVQKWDTKHPKIYKLMMRVKIGDRFMEYIPCDVGFVDVNYSDKKLSINGNKVTVKPASMAYYYRYSSETELKKLIADKKKKGFNTLILNHPQPKRFYEVCQREGMYVIDAVNLSTNQHNLESSIANHPCYLNQFYDRTENLIQQHKNYFCIIGWSLGSGSINGYNYKKCYQLIKNKLDTNKPVIYPAAKDDWNNDIIN